MGCVAIWQLQSVSLQRSRDFRGEHLGTTVGEPLRIRRADNRCRLSKVQSHINYNCLTGMPPQDHGHRVSPTTVVYLEPPIPAERSNEILNGLLMLKS